jgi:hypothetical protein
MFLLVSAATLPCMGRELDRRCLEGDCVILTVENGRVFAERTGEFAGKREVAKVEEAGVPFVPATEAPLNYTKTSRGWITVVSVFLPKEYDFDAPELHLYLYDAQRDRKVVSDLYNFLGSLNVGRIFHGTNAEFVQVSSTGAHAYVVRTIVWLLPAAGTPAVLLDVPGLLSRIQQATSKEPAGLWINRQTYDGVHAETKGEKPEFWMWNPNRKTLILAPGR